VRLDDVWLRYRRGDPWVLRGASIELRPGEAATVVGRNGVGKSTLLKLAAGLLRAQKGAVRDRPARIGYVPERFPADQPFTARRYLVGMARIHGLAAADAGPAVEGWAERLHCAGLLDTAMPELSKGSAQKVGLIQAVLCHPELLVLDEPWEGLDAATRAEIPLIVAETIAAGGRVLISDHLGSAGELPGVRRWELVDGTLVEAADERLECVIEVAVATSDVPAAVASLRAAGHRVLGVRGQ
jgi:ABC-2 type transport system ATP-binding protein